jgi:hypothetical protein
MFGRKIGAYVDGGIVLSIDPPVMCRRVVEAGALVGEEGGRYESNLRGEVGGDLVGDRPKTSSRLGRFAWARVLVPNCLT